jgi:hypothetical protein
VVSVGTVLWHVNSLLGGDSQISDGILAVARQRPANSNRRMVLFALSAKQQLNRNKVTVFSVRSVPRLYNEDQLQLSES